MHDPLHVVGELRRPWPRRSKLHRAGQEETDPLYRHRQFGPVHFRPRRFHCAHCDNGKVHDPPPSYHEHAGLYAGEDCPDCLGRGWQHFSWRARLPYFGWAFWRFGKTEWYFPPLVTLWHKDPEVGGDDDSCAREYRTRWRQAHKDGDGLREWFWRWMMGHYGWWHFRHWQVQVSPWQDLCRWLFTRCAYCHKRFPWSYSPVSHSWGGLGPKWGRGEVGVYHHECSAKAHPPPEAEVVPLHSS